MSKAQGAAPPAAKISLGRPTSIFVVVYAIGSLLAVAGGIRGGLHSTGSSRVLAFGIAALFTAPLVIFLMGMPRCFGSWQVLVDSTGLTIQPGHRSQVLPWQDIASVGISYAIAQEAQSAQVALDPLEAVRGPISAQLTAAAMQATQASRRRQLALEIYPAGPGVLARYPRMQPYVQEQFTPGAAFWRFPLPPAVAIAQQLSSALYAWSPQRWFGWVRRPWIHES
jgi:hypothetical protein